MHFPWLLLRILMMLIAIAKDAQPIRNARHNRRARVLYMRVIAARDDDHNQRDAGKDSYTECHV